MTDAERLEMKERCSCVLRQLEECGGVMVPMGDLAGSFPSGVCIYRVVRELERSGDVMVYRRPSSSPTPRSVYVSIMGAY